MIKFLFGIVLGLALGYIGASSSKAAEQFTYWHIAPTKCGWYIVNGNKRCTRSVIA